MSTNISEMLGSLFSPPDAHTHALTELKRKETKRTRNLVVNNMLIVNKAVQKWPFAATTGSPCIALALMVVVHHIFVQHRSFQAVAS